ncbi:MFS transporter [Levilactobacillus huananensis]|uniref:MFS transporter n=1 Tax=Levilactobacillus huananensis TaxID=2486019 RepID=UPI000F780814|nr:MFS transporter [Levilactobacillus huananensis]
MFKNSKIILILVTAMNLRLAITAITPLFSAIQQALHVASAYTALLVTIPLLCFSLGAIAAPKLIQHLGILPLILMTTGILIIANLIRPLTTATMLLGTLLIGLAIALLNVLVPTMIAQVTTTHVTRLTSYYAVTMNVVAAMGTAGAMPLAGLWGWRAVLMGFALPAVLTLVIASRLPRHSFHQQATTTPPLSLTTTLRHDPQAWKLTVFMGLQSLIFYSLTTWLPTIFQALGASDTTAGTLLAVFQLVGIPAALFLNMFTNLRQLLAGLLVGYLAGVLCLAWSGIGWWLAAILLGFTSALIFTLALTLIATSSQDVATIANRSAIAQSLGYLLAAVGPFIFGEVHDIFGNWSVVLMALIVLMVVTIGSGLLVAPSSK